MSVWQGRAQGRGPPGAAAGGMPGQAGQPAAGTPQAWHCRWHQVATVQAAALAVHSSSR